MKGGKGATDSKLWKHIMLKVKKRKRLENGTMGNLCQAVNMVSGEKCTLLVDSKLIVEQDVEGLEVVLRDYV